MDAGKETEFSSLGLHRFVTDEDMKLEIKMERPELEPERQPQRTEEACLPTQLETVAQGLTATLQHIKEEANEGLSSQRWEGQWQKFLNKSQAPLLDQGNVSLSKPVMQTNVKETQGSFERPMNSSHWSNGQNVIQTRSAFTGMAKDAQSLNSTNRRGSEPTKESEKEDPTYLECQRQRFRQFSYREAKGPWEAYCQLRKFCHHWLMPELHTKEEILELVILEQFLAILPQEMLSWIRERDSESCFHAVALAEHFLLRQQETELQDQPATGIKQEAAVNFPAGEGALLDVTLRQLYKEVKQEGGGDTNQTPCNGGQKEGDGLLLERENCQDLPEASPIQVEPTGHLGREAEEHGNACISSQDRSPFGAAIQPTVPKVKRPSDHLFHGLNRHQRPHTEGELYVCTDCGKAFISKAGFFTHIRIHGREKPYECSDCGKNFRRSSHLNSHSKIHAGVKPFKCLDCGKGFSRSSNLISHQRMHTGEKPYACSSCSKQFCDKSSLVRHERLHTGDKPFKCTECGKSFSQSHHLITHQRSHTGEKPYKCLLCNKSFCDRSTYMRHQKNHTGEKIFKCSHCGESFSRNKHLTRHQSIHTARELHTCSDCGESFCRRSGLKMHQKIHTGEKPYECPDCGKKFNRSTNLISHQRIHTGERPYGCPDCGKRFNRRTHLVSHQKTHGQRKEMTGGLGAGGELPTKVAYESPPYIITTV